MGPDEAVREVEAEVIELLPRATFRLRLRNEDRVLAHVAGAAKNFIRLRPGDKVMVAISPHDRSRGRIVKLLDGG